MKNDKGYKHLKRKILSETLFATLLATVVGGVILVFLIDGIFQKPFSKGVIGLLQKLGLTWSEANHVYGQVFMYNKDLFLLIGFIILFLIFFYIAVGKLTSYMNEIGKGIENIMNDSEEVIELEEELQPIEEKLNTIKNTLQTQKKESMEEEKRKNELILYLAHDLKTPLTSVIAYLNILDKNQEMPQEEKEKYIHISLEKAMRLGNLINEFFEITRLNLQEIQLEKNTLNVSMMLEQLADECYGVMTQRNLTCRVAAEEELYLEGDPDKLARVFDNLLRNAISYSHRGTCIEITAVQIEDEIEIAFMNHGKPIPEDKLDMIFNKFIRVDAARNTQTGGAGLGLAISKEIVELHGGRIKAESQDGITRFIVDLPGQKRSDPLKPSRRSKIGKTVKLREID